MNDRLRDSPSRESDSVDTSDVVVYNDSDARVAHVKRSLFDLEPTQQVAKATEIANALCDVIEKQKLYSVIQGKKYVLVEAWELMGTFLGILPRENRVVRLEDGSYEATVDLIRTSDGRVVGGASAICGMDEQRWSKAQNYARRSMAVTRATGKAYRLSFSWIINLAGYEATPAEEMPREEIPFEPKKETKGKPYQGEPEQVKIIQEVLMNKNVPVDKWDEIGAKMKGKYSKDLTQVIKEVTQQ